VFLADKLVAGRGKKEEEKKKEEQGGTGV